jgi:CubicO group peptidase (beta-lactamase class C family)
MKLTGVLLIILISAPFCAKCQNPELTDLDSFIEGTLLRWNVPGMAISIVRDGKVIYQKGFGKKDIQNNEEVEPQTLFYIASATKTFTATLASFLHQEKIIDIDKPVRSYIDGFTMVDEMAAQKVTLRDMLTHRTGIPREKFFTLNDIGSRKDVLYSYSQFEPAADFRSNYIYSNENYTVAGDIMGEAAGSSWEKLIDEKLFSPLDMENSFFSKDDVSAKNLATPYIDWGEGNEKMDLYDAQYLGAAGCIISNVKDLSNWITFYLDRGKFTGTQLIHPNYLIQQLSAQIPTRPMSSFPELSFECYGIGWFLDYYRGHFHVHHGGVLYGYTSLISFLPYQKTGIAILTNKNNTHAATIIERYIYDKLLGLEVVDWNSRFKQQEERMLAMMKRQEESTTVSPTEKIDANTAQRFVGEYLCKGFGQINIQYKDNKLICLMRGIQCQFKKIEGNRFELYHPVERQGWEVSFDVKDGEVVGFFVGLGIGDQKVYYKMINT